MKNKLGKRIISILLSALMVVSMLPTFALSASAAVQRDSHLLGEYLVNDATTGIQTNTGVTWDSNKKEAYFNGSSYLQLSGTPMSTVSSSTGFTISFDFYKEDGGYWARFFDFSDGTTNNCFAVNAGQDDWRSYASIYKLNGNEYCYYTNDLGSTEHCDVTSEYFVGHYKEWHNMAFSMDTDGYYYVYIDGVLRGKFKNTLNDQQANIMNKFADLTTYYIGYDVYGDPCYKGYMKNFRLYNCAYNQLTGAERLNNVMAAYEARMNGAVYTNMAAAYTAYVNANKALDSYYYGGAYNTVTDANHGTLADTLATAISNMSIWSDYSETQSVAMGSNSVNNCSNVLYASDTVNFVPSNYYGIGSTNFKTITNDKVVLYYNGDDSKTYFPVGLEVKRNGNGNRQYDYAYFAQSVADYDGQPSVDPDTKIELRANWRGYQDGWGSGLDWAAMWTNGTDRFGYQQYGGGFGFVIDGTRYYGNIAYYKSTAPTQANPYPDNSLAKNGLIYEIYNNQRNHCGGYNADTDIYVVDYYQVTQRIKDYNSYFSNVMDYSQGGLSSIATALDVATAFNLSDYAGSSTAYEDAKYQIDNVIVPAFNGISATADVDYDTLRSNLTDGLSKSFDTFGTKTASEVYADSALNTTTLSNYKAFSDAFEAAQQHMAGLPSGSYNSNTASSLASTLSSTFDALSIKGAEEPSISGESALGPDDEITITNNDSETVTISYTITFNNSDTASDSFTLASGATKNVNVFGGSTAYESAAISVKATKNNKDSSSVNASYTFIKAPSFSVSDGAVLTEDDAVTFSSNNSLGGTVYYSYDNSSWFVPTSGGNYVFTENDTAVQGIYAKEVVGNSTSKIAHISVLRKASFSIYTNNTKGNTFYDDSTTIFIEDTSNYSDDIVYTLVADGTAVGTIHTYDKTNKINLSNSGTVENAIKNANVVEIVAYAAPHGVLIGTEGTLVTSATLVKASAAADRLVYQESFDGADVNESSFTTGSSKGLNGTLANSGTASVIEGTAGAGVFDQRKNVLKINGATAASRGNYIQFDSNPLATPVNSAVAKADGMTISFWRYVTAAGTNNIATSGDDWTNIVNFTSYDSENETNRYRYSTLTATGRLGFVQRDNENGASVNGGWLDYFPNNNDISNHSTDVHHGYWTNIVLTVNPKATDINDAVVVYINGEPHDISSLSANGAVDLTRNLAGDFSSYTVKELADEIIDFYTSSTTHFDLAYGAYDESDKSLDVYVDDIRIYTEVKTQVDINNMYSDEYSDTVKDGSTSYQSSTSHDPTNVTVYTLKSAVTTENGTKAAGSQVGQEFIDYYNVPSSNYTVEYYSFGTGLTVYKSSDNLNWTVVGDSKGRCGYQNQGLFVSATGSEQPYTTTLSEPLTWAAQGKSINGGDVREGAAGKLVWAPHVMYNLSQDKWMYYGSTSAWVSNYSAVFLLTSDFVDHGYKYQQMIVKTHGNDHEEGYTDSTNAIDSCVYYGHNADGSIDKSSLYCLYGSWGNIMVKTLNADGTRSDGETDFGSLLSIARNGGEGGYMTYRNGYYYYFISPGSNGWGTSGGAYQVRTYRSQSPDKDFVSYTGASATQDTSHHGNTMMTGYSLNADGFNYEYTSIGHSSIYNAQNAYGENVDIIASHTREYAKDGVAVEDGQLTTRQIWLVGNVAIHNPVAFTNDGWPTAFPKLYDETFSLQNKGASNASRTYFTAYDLDGVYAANVFYDDNNDSGYREATQTFKIYATSNTTGLLINSNVTAGQRFELTYSSDNKTTYITLYNDDNSVHASGVIANQGTLGSAVPEFSYVIHSSSWDPQVGCTAWGIRTGDNETKEDIEEAFDNIEGPSNINGIAYHEGNPADNKDGTKAYSNVAYSTKTTAWGGELNKFYQYMHIALPTTSVLVYDGVTQPSLPLAFSNVSNGSHDQRFKSVVSTTSNFELKKNWVGFTDSNTSGVEGQEGTGIKIWPGSYIMSGDSGAKEFSYLSSAGVMNEGQDNTSAARYWWNQLYYTGSVNTSSYYETITNPTFHAYGRYSIAFNFDEDGDLPSPESTIYVINYKPIYQILNGDVSVPGTDGAMLDVYDDIKANPNKYTKSSVQRFYLAMEMLLDADPMSYTYEGRVASDVESCAKNIKLAKAAFDAINLEKRADLTKLENAYNKADSLLLSLDGKIAQYDANSVNALISAVTAPNVSKYLSADDETKAEYSETVQTDADSLADDILDALDGLKIVANNVSAETVDAYETAVATINKLDPDAYNQTQSITTAISNTNTIVGDSSVEYGDATINVVAMSASDQDVQDAVSAILSALTTSVKTYTIKTYGVDETSFNNGTFSGESETYTATYGTTVTCVGDPLTAWYLGVKTNTTEKKLTYYGYGRRLQIKVMGDLEIKAVKPTEDNYQIKIVRDYDDTETAPVQYVNYVSSGYEFELPAAPAYAYYTFAGYEVGGNAYNAGDKFSITADTEIVAKYNHNDDAACAINSNKGNVSTSYNNKVTLEGDENTYGWVEQTGENSFRPFYIGKNVTFFASETTTLNAVNEETFKGYKFTSPVINLRQSGTMQNGTKTIFNAQLFDGGKEVKEYGILVGVGSFNEDDLTIENSGKHEEFTVVRAKSTKLVGANQFSIAINNLPNGYKYRGYVIYENGENEFVTNYTDIN
ncbi:MAG: hypothetical protein IJR70_08640 [Eubacterium sp.]|nr:hypothetical protein [Eubacterium sp.]